MNKILILEDDLVLLETLYDEFLAEDYVVDMAKNGQEVLELTYQNNYDLYIFDINVPYIKGTSLLKELRDAEDTTPAIFLTSMHEEENIIDGFNSGCDDYMVKPFSLQELKLRVKAILKRYGKNSHSNYKDVSIDLESNYLKIGDTEHVVDHKELQIFSLFILNPKKVISYETIVQEIYNDKIPSNTVIRVHISNINKLFKQKRIKNIRAVGYIYDDESE